MKTHKRKPPLKRKYKPKIKSDNDLWLDRDYMWEHVDDWELSEEQLDEQNYEEEQVREAGE